MEKFLVILAEYAAAQEATQVADAAYAASWESSDSDWGEQARRQTIVCRQKEEEVLKRLLLAVQDQIRLTKEATEEMEEYW